jgi:kynurenine formamidase
MVRLLSYPLGPMSAAFPGTSTPVFQETSRIERGDHSNWITFTTHNHASTHVDGPWHFNPQGRRITELDPAEFVFDAPRLIDVPRSDDELIGAAELEPHLTAIRDSDLLLVRTGYAARWRATDLERYRAHSPGFHRSAGELLLREAPRLRAVAMDLLSPTCSAQPEEGLEFHRVMLGRRATDRYVLLVEDSRIDADLRQEDLGRVIAAPLLLEGQDGGQVTMIALPPVPRPAA